MTDPDTPRGGPLVGIRVLELAGMGPGPHGAMLLADLGADVVRVQRPGTLPADGRPAEQQLRGRTIVEADPKSPAGRPLAPAARPWCPRTDPVVNP